MRNIFILIATLLTFSACSNNYQPDPRVKIIGHCSNSAMLVSDVNAMMRDDGFMQTQITGENLTSSYFKVEYKIVWFDENNFKIDSILSNWAEIPAYAEQPFYINVTAPSNKAKTFRLYLKKEGNLICEQQSN